MDSPLLISLGHSAPAWYRCALPAMYLGWDWIGTSTLGVDPPGAILTGNIEEEPVISNYETIVLQQAMGQEWLDWIKQRQANGQKVIYELDDYIHGVWNVKGHRFQSHYSKKRRKLWEVCMRQCDGMLFSTEFLAKQYRKINSNQYVCHNAIDTLRYNVEFPDREDQIVIGWAGGTGHNTAIAPWLEPIAKILNLYKNVHFVTMGAQYAEILANLFPNKTLSVPWGTIENLPYMLTHIDIAIAPAHNSKYFLSKSDLRWLEASAVGLPTVAGIVDGQTPYSQINHEETGFLAESPDIAADYIMELIEDETLRESISSNAREYVQTNRDIRENCEHWVEAISTLTA